MKTGIAGTWVIAGSIGIVIGLANARGADPDIQGSWMSPCYVQGGQELKKDLYVVSSRVYTTQSLYNERGCFDLKMKLDVVQSYEIARSHLVSGATEVDLYMQRTFLTVFDAVTANLWDSAKFCGITDWGVGIPRDVTGRNCGGHAVPKAGDKEYDLYLKESASKLWIGLRSPSLDGSSPEKRPRELDRTVGFRQLAD